MSRAIVVQAGPLAASSATKIATATKAAGANYIVLDGAAGTATSNSICASQTPSGAGALTINGTLATTDRVIGFGGTDPTAGSATVRFPTPVRIYITSAGNDSSRTFTVVGTLQGPATFGPGAVVSETITGANASKISAVNLYSTIISISVDAATAGAVTVGHYGPATLDRARRVLWTPAGSDSGITATFAGFDGAGNAIGETLTGVNNPSTTYTVLDYLVISSIKLSGAAASTLTIGTNGICSSPWARLDEFGAMGPTAIQVDGSGTVNWTVSQTLQDPNSTSNPIAPQSLDWVVHPDTAMVASTTTTGVQANYAYPPKFARVTLNSNGGTTAYVAMTIMQNFQK